MDCKNHLILIIVLYLFRFSNHNKIIVGYGSNGVGKLTLKELFTKPNLKKNFELEKENQQNELFNEFGSYKYLIYDDKFIDSFVFSNDGLKKSQSKMRMILN